MGWREFTKVYAVAAPKLNEEQRITILEWLAADYSAPLIVAWAKEREWPEITEPAVRYYRAKWRAEIDSARTARRSEALTTGLALKEERVVRLKTHADALEAIKWVADPKSGRLWNEKAWRETLDDIAREMGHRRQGIDVDLVEKELDAALDKLRDSLPSEVYAQVLAALARGEG